MAVIRDGQRSAEQDRQFQRDLVALIAQRWRAAGGGAPRVVPQVGAAGG